MATQDKNGKWKMTEANIKQREAKKAEVEKNRQENYADGENWIDKDGQLHKPNGQFAKGNKPKTTFADRPEDRNAGGWKPENTPTYQYRRFWNMPKKEFIDLCKRWGLVKPEGDEKFEIDNDHTVVEESAARRVLASMSSLPEMREITNRVEGMPTAKVEAKVENKYSNLTDEELKALARAEFEA